MLSLATVQMILLIVFRQTLGAVYKIDVTLFDNSPLVDMLDETSDDEIRIYMEWDDRDAEVTQIGRYGNTGTGDVGIAYQNPSPGKYIPNGHGFPTRTEINGRRNTDYFERLEIKFESAELSRIGVFYATIEKGSNSLTIPIIKIAENASITPNEYTQTTSIGDSVTIRVTTAVSNLRWVHNNGEVIAAWNDMKEVTIDNVRLADEGIYECFEDGKRDLGQHAIMRLIVRECPSPKWGLNCSESCRTCWNGGICSSDNGVCLCQPGFYGGQCGQRHGSNNWGARGRLYCSSGSGNCRTALICGPDPSGCSCVAGYSGLDCTTRCSSGWYGSNCNRRCNCDSVDCDPEVGCRSMNYCNTSFDENFCQGRTECDRGYFGAQCEYVCHCANGEGCDKKTGVCNNKECADKWDGGDCQIALPYFINNSNIHVNVSGTSATVTWNAWDKHLDYGTGPVDSYHVKYYGLDSSIFRVEPNPTSEASITITNLEPEAVYNFAVAAVQSGNYVGPYGMETFDFTGCGAPTLSPTITDVTQVENNRAKLSWTIPDGTSWMRCSQGLSNFVITYSTYDNVKTDTEIASAREHITESLTPCMVYDFQIRATNKDADGNDSLPISIEVIVAPEQIDAIEFQENRILWDEPESVCEVTDYVVDVIEVDVDQCKDSNPALISNTVVENTYLVLRTLKYFTTYRATVQGRYGRTTRGTAEPRTSEFTTGESVPTGAPDNIKSSSPDDGSLLLSWERPPCGQRHGNIILYEYEYGLKLHPVMKERGNTSETEVLLRDLKNNKTYEFRIRAYTVEGSGPFSVMYDGSASGPLQGSSSLSAVIGSIVGVLVLVVLVVAVVVVVVLKRRRSKTRDDVPGQQTKSQRESGIAYENIDFSKEKGVTIGKTNVSSDKPAEKPKAVVKPIPDGAVFPMRDEAVTVEGFMEYVEIKKAGGPDHELKKDFEALPKGNDVNLPMTEAAKPENRTKNRYKNIIPYDHSRVCLEPLDTDPHSGYINASYIDGYKKNKAYIAAQGPNVATVKDIWRMIWQENSGIIIMVTGLSEGGKIKCEKYWPDLGNEHSYGEYSVTNKQEDDKGYYIVRYLTMSKTEIYANQASPDEGIRHIKQFHYTGWPDMKVPEFSEPILTFLDHMNTCNPTDAGPIVVHCSAGIGRTGTFIAIDAMLKMARTENKVDVFNYVYQMRQQRPGMIQTEAQYTFVHDALLEALFCGKTTIPTSEFDKIWPDVEAAKNGKDNHILGQFKTLCSMFPAKSEKQYAGGKNKENLSKNRYSTFIPPDSFRPKLSTPGDAQSNDFISAAFCHGHEHRNLYLTAQVPLPHTVEDFWRLILDYQFKTIVTLNDPKETNKSFGTYWPTEGSLQRGQFVIKSTEIETSNALTTERTLQFHQVEKPDTSRTVHLIQYNDWPVDAELPSSVLSFVRLLDRVDVHRRDNADQRVVVIDKDGVTRCGVFCSVISVVDQIKDKQEVDAFRAVKRLKVCRHEMINSLEQYLFCYEAARVYLQSFETYANFT